jgi:hypothetical protein
MPIGSIELHQGRRELEAYLRPQLERFGTTAFGLEEISPTADGVELDYLDFDGAPVRASFAFELEGKISRMRCVPVQRSRRAEIFGRLARALSVPIESEPGSSFLF